MSGGADPGGIGAFIRSEETHADIHIVRDISKEAGIFRWAFLNPEMQFRVKTSEDLNFQMEFAIPEVTFKKTGPVTVSCSINGRPLGSVRCPNWGQYSLKKPVPADWVQPKDLVHVTFHAEPRWISPEDKAELSFLLRSAGFVD